MTPVVSGVLLHLSWLVASAGLVAGLAAVCVTRRLLPSLGVFLDLLLAAGLLRLATAGSWQAIAGAAAIVAIRKLAVLGLRSSGRRPAREPVGQPS
ncbi:hypothetical protein GCM10027517_26760 [Phycicoccus ginsengisoli]